MMLEFMAALYNEEEPLPGLIHYVAPFVDRLNFVNDGSTDETEAILDSYWTHGDNDGISLNFRTIKHTGLPETVKSYALKMCNPDSWVILLDADERFAHGVLQQIKDFVNSPMADEYTHVWFTLNEYIDGLYSGRTFLKCRLFRARDAHFADTIHVSDWFDGPGANFGWVVNHVKTSVKQRVRETEYIATYDRLVDEGKMTDEQRQQARSLHYFIK